MGRCSAGQAGVFVRVGDRGIGRCRRRSGSSRLRLGGGTRRGGPGGGGGGGGVARRGGAVWAFPAFPRPGNRRNPAAQPPPAPPQRPPQPPAPLLASPP